MLDRISCSAIDQCSTDIYPVCEEGRSRVGERDIQTLVHHSIEPTQRRVHTYNVLSLILAWNL